MTAAEYTVDLGNFSGPLDLLLYLIKEEEVEIHEIPIATICDRYLAYLKALAVLDVDVASDFLVMASTLMLIKSRALLPTEDEVDLEEELDPEDELIQQLLEFKRFKMAARDLAERREARALVMPIVSPRRETDQDLPLEEIDLWDLVRAFSHLLRETGLDRSPRLIRNDRPLREFIAEVFAVLRERRALAFSEMFEGKRDADTIVGRFLALLELVRRQRVKVSQAGAFDEIEIALMDDRDLSEDEFLAAEADNRSVIGEDVPDPESLEREFLETEALAADPPPGDPEADGDDAAGAETDAPAT